MARTLSNILRSIVAKLPTGFALGLRDGVLDVVLESAAGRVEVAELDAEALMRETDPRTANSLLPDFERVLGPDPCGRDLDLQSLADRQRLAHQRWTATGGQSVAYMIAIAARLGVTITVEEFWPRYCGRLRCGQQLRGNGAQYTWRINVPGLVTVTKFRAGASVAGDLLGDFKISSIECELRRIKPAHTTLVFSYAEA